MDTEIYERFELDIRNTIMSNMPGLMLLFLLIVFVYKGADLASSFSSAEMRLIFAIVWVFSVLELAKIVMTHTSHLAYRERE